MKWIIECLKENKSLCEFNATAFNADKVKLYKKVRQMMAAKYATENYFGPALGSGKGATFFVISTLAEVDSAGRVTLFPGTTFLHISGALVSLIARVRNSGN